MQTDDGVVEGMLFCLPSKMVYHCHVCILSQNAAVNPTRR